MPDLNLNMAFPTIDANSEANAAMQSHNFMQAYQANIQRQDPLGPLKRQEMQNKIKDSALDIQGRQLVIDQKQQEKADSVAGMNFLSQYTKEADDPNALAHLTENLSKANISLPMQERFLKAAEQIDQSSAKVEATRALAQQRRDAADNAIELARTKAALAADPNNAKLQMQMLNLQARRDSIEIARGNLVERQLGTGLRYNQAVQNAVGLTGKLAGEGLESAVPLAPTPLPGTAASGIPAPAALVRPAVRPMTSATATKLQESVVNAQQSLAAIDGAIAAVDTTPEAFGPLGGVRQKLEVARGLISPGQPSPVTSARVAADISAEDIIRGLKQDANISKFEKQQLDDVARITRMVESPSTARDKLIAIGKSIAGKAIRQSKDLGTSPPTWALRRLEDTDLQKAAINGLITGAEARSEYLRRHPDQAPQP